ncbi:MAG: tetratricopeptide repeat protein [Scytolyngbya sp. HA4215-MV1]|jgi:CHAT domain-containing protein|nr:tetratricopeptide repeat protein [Scytolyngbya sp. HA4215-MV1]
MRLDVRSLTVVLFLALVSPVLPIATTSTQGQTVSDRKTEADRLFQQGIQQYQTSQFEVALQSWQQSLQMYREIQDRLGEGYALGNLGNAYYALGNYGKAIEYHEQSLAIAREIKNRLGEGQSLGNLGVAYYALGNYGKAIEHHEQSLAIAREIKNRLGEGQSLGNLGNAYDALGNYGKAIEYHEQSLAIAQEIKDRLGEGQSLGNLGIAYDALGNYGKAIEYQEQRLAIAREIKDRLGEGAALGNLGLAYFSLDNYDKAIEYQEQSLAIKREIKDRLGEGYALGNLGNAYFSLGNYGKAIEYQEQALTIAREIKDRLGEGAALGNLGLTYDALGNYGKAIEYQEQHLAIAREIKDRNGEGQSLNNLGNALFKSGDLLAAAKTLMDGIVVWEALRQTGAGNDANKVSIFEEQARTYRTLQKVLVAQNQPNAALEISERGRARAFVELLAQRLATDKTDKQEGVLSNPASVSSVLESVVKPPTIQQIQQIAKAHNATLVQYSVLYDDFKIQGKLETRQSELYLWVIHPDGKIDFRKVDLSQNKTPLTDLITESRLALGARSRDADVVVAMTPAALQQQKEKQTQNLRLLHQLLIAPIADLLPIDPNQRVIFLPQGELFLVPFPALTDANGTALIEQHTILTAPSIQVLELTQQQRKGVRSQESGATKALVVGNPAMPQVQLQVGSDAVQLPALPGAEGEARGIAELLKTNALIGNQARKSAVVKQMPTVRLIHLATHGLLDDVKGMGVPGAIALAPDRPGEPNDGLLTANEILDMKLKAELVVLSACDTGRGNITGDGVIGRRVL